MISFKSFIISKLSQSRLFMTSNFWPSLLRSGDDARSRK